MFNTFLPHLCDSHAMHHLVVTSDDQLVDLNGNLVCDQKYQCLRSYKDIGTSAHEEENESIRAGVNAYLRPKPISYYNTCTEKEPCHESFTTTYSESRIGCQDPIALRWLLNSMLDGKCGSRREKWKCGSARWTFGPRSCAFNSIMPSST